MAVEAKKMVVGFNHNIKHKGKMYHIQTEDSGLENPHIITHLFVGGNILASKKTSYADIVGAENLAAGRARADGGAAQGDAAQPHQRRVRRHRHRLRRSRRSPTSPARSTPTAAGCELQAGRRRWPAARRPRQLPPEVLAARQEPAPVLRNDGAETLFGEDLISEKSLDEVILSYLAEDLGDRK